MSLKSLALTLVTGLAAGTAGAGAAAYRKYRAADEYKNKILDYYGILNRWLAYKQQGRSLSEFFVRHGYQTVAIYGIGELGERLYDELKDTGIEVKYIIDKNVKGAWRGIEVKRPELSLPEVDVIVVTADYYFVEIEQELRNNMNYPVYFISDVIYEM